MFSILEVERPYFLIKGVTIENKIAKKQCVIYDIHNLLINIILWKILILCLFKFYQIYFIQKIIYKVAL